MYVLYLPEILPNTDFTVQWEKRPMSRQQQQVGWDSPGVGARPGSGTCSGAFGAPLISTVALAGMPPTSYFPKEEPTDSCIFPVFFHGGITVKGNQVINQKNPQETKIPRVPKFLGHPQWCGS